MIDTVQQQQHRNCGWQIAHTPRIVFRIPSEYMFNKNPYLISCSIQIIKTVSGHQKCILNSLLFCVCVSLSVLSVIYQTNLTHIGIVNNT